LPNIGNGKNAGYVRGADKDAKGLKESKKWDSMKIQE
jgi:hypothetical protein